jgi:Zn-dependent protease
MEITILFFIAILIMSVVIHEISHGFAAEYLGDPTARLAGRLTLNPIPHLDPIGSILVPAIGFMTLGFGFGWARPVPYNPYNLKDQRWGPAIVALAGPLSNVLIALIFGILIRMREALSLPSEFVGISAFIVFLNLLLAVFNMIPIPPLDGSKVFSAFLPYRYMQMFESLQNYGLVIVLAIVFFAWPAIEAVIQFFFVLITGAPY